MPKPIPAHTSADVPMTPSDILTEEWTIRRLKQDSALGGESLNDKLIAHLASLELLTEAQTKEIREKVSHGNVILSDLILEKKILTESQIGQAFSDFFKVPYAAIKGINIPANLIQLIPKDVVRRNKVLVYAETPDSFGVAMANPSDFHLIHFLEKKFGKKVEVHYTTPHQIEQALKNYPLDFEDNFSAVMARASENFERLASLDNIAQVFDSLVLIAFQRGASDVHIEPFEEDIRVRFRVDGVLSTITVLPKTFLDTIINHIKVLAHLRTDEHNAAQDGRFKVTYEKITINFRVSIMPTYHGEKAVLRLLTSEAQEMSLADLGYGEADDATVSKYIKKSNGMILVCGPTGSGKTTTLYALLKSLNSEGINISTIEDPIEYSLPGMVQIQVNPRTNITYAEGLKALLRQDPDILMIGEIRDADTGKIAVNAALTGHLVLSTMHTNNASLAPLRLVQMGVDPYLITTTVQLIVAQRLVRRICPLCITSYNLKATEFKKLEKEFGMSPEQVTLFEKLFSAEKKGGNIRAFKGKGCKKCGDTGYQGRMVIAEVLEMKGKVRDLILKSANEDDIQKAAGEAGMTTMLQDGLMKVLSGITTLDEVFRVINQ